MVARRLRGPLSATCPGVNYIISFENWIGSENVVIGVKI